MNFFRKQTISLAALFYYYLCGYDTFYLRPELNVCFLLIFVSKLLKFSVLPTDYSTPILQWSLVAEVHELAFLTLYCRPCYSSSPRGSSIRIAFSFCPWLDNEYMVYHKVLVRRRLVKFVPLNFFAKHAHSLQDICDIRPTVAGPTIALMTIVLI